MNAKSSPRRKGVRASAAAMTAALTAGLVFAAPAHSMDSDRTITIDFDSDEDFLEDLIELDAEGIADMRAEFADARAEIDDAVDEIRDAREEARSAPGGEFIVKIAFAVAKATVRVSIDRALNDVGRAVDKAERDLATADVSDAERIETQGVIDILRVELASLRTSLDELAAALDD